MGGQWGGPWGGAEGGATSDLGPDLISTMSSHLVPHPSSPQPWGHPGGVLVSLIQVRDWGPERGNSAPQSVCWAVTKPQERGPPSL